jgi:hypothetical protein
MIKESAKSNTVVRSSDLGKSQSLAHIPPWINIVVILGALLIIVGAVISKVAPTMLTNGVPMTGAA